MATNEQVVQETEEPLTIEEYQDRYQRALADLENLRKRKIKEIDQARDQGEAHVAREFLPIVDDFKRALRVMAGQLDGNETVEERGRSMLEGWRQIVDKFIHTLKSLEIEGFATEGKAFAAEFMEAVCQVRSPLPPGTVVQELSQGFTRRGKLLLPAQVIVAIPEDEP